MASLRRTRVIMKQLKPEPTSEEVQQVSALQTSRENLQRLIADETIAAQVTKLAWQDSVNGTQGRIMLAEGEDADLDNAIALLRKARASDVSWADLIQMASAVAIQNFGGPRVPMRYGRKDDLDLGKSSEVRMALRDTLHEAATTSSAVELVSKLGLSSWDQVALLGDSAAGLTSRGPTVPQSTPDMDNEARKQLQLYERDPLAHARDYAWAHSSRSEVGAMFQPQSGLYID